MSTLSSGQRTEYEELGFLLVSGLIPESILTPAEARLRQMVEKGEVASGHGSFDEPALVACYTPELLRAAAELTGADLTSFKAPSRAYIINALPSPDPWEWPRPHIDHAIKEDGYRTFPAAFKVAAMTYLSDVEKGGGGTVVWPGSHRALHALACSDPRKYESMWALNQDLELAGLRHPLELTPRHGDVLFYHYLCAHAGSRNVTHRPRLAMNAKWQNGT